MTDIHIGTSGWNYPHWRDRFYPANAGSETWLTHYATRLSTVEINSSFHRRSDLPAFADWAAATPAGFSFAVTAWRAITHMKRLRNCDDLLARFLDQLLGLAGKHGPVLFQFPLNWRCNTRRLGAFLDALPAGYRYAFEFRDVSWHNDAVFDLLHERNAAFCMYQIARFRSMRPTPADFVYVRLYGSAGPYRGNYSESTIRTWAGWSRRWRDEGRDVYFYFCNDENGYAIKNAVRLNRILGKF